MPALVSILKELRSALWRSKPQPQLPRLPRQVASRAMAGIPAVEVNKDPLDLGALVVRLVAERHARGQRVRLLVDAGGRTGVPTHRVPGQVLAMRQEIDQLVDHALQQGGVVELVVREDRSGVRVSVNERRPDGSGLRAELQYPRAA
ncbi:hypothetical protein [Hydrogenophaga sp. RWCD_12]|uniref:hypothetical protein n=1 Tax=Hydrogenophaga sp. RWCD_12 TaxID=3391190 RepID=UPI0039852217